MDNPHEILSTLEETVERLKVIHEEKGGAPLNDDVVELRQLCISVEEVLRHQQKDKLSFWGERRDYWHYLSEGVSKVKNFEKCLKQVQKLTQYTTSQGKGRALIRECLSQQLLADCIQNCLSNQKRTKEWYHPTAMVLVDSFVQRLLTALYDLSDVTFDLPQDGLELDETWPAFVIKSFRDQNGVRDSPGGVSHRSPLQKVLGGTTKVAEKAEKRSQKVQIIEKAIEEQPSEVYIKREIPFDLDMVGSLLADICDCFKPATEHAQIMGDLGPLPELKVAKLNDITTGLSVLKGCVRSWTQEMTQKGMELHEDNKSLKARQLDLEMQVQETMRESDYSETDLVRQLQECRDELRVLYSDHQRVTSENEELSTLLCRNNEKMKEMEDLNFNLEEQLARCEAETSGERQRAYSVLEVALQEKEENFDKLSAQLEQSEASNKQLLQSLEDSQTRLEQQSVVIEQHQKNEENKRELEERLQELKEHQKTLEGEIADLKSQNSALVADLEMQQRSMEQETSEKIELESKKWLSVERERDRLKAELAEAHSTVENEMSALKFKLSSINIDLQQAKEQSSKKDRTIAELRNQSRNLESQVSEAREQAEVAEKELEDIKLELQDIEGVLSNQQTEMASLHEQLTEKSLSRDQERAAMLKEQTLWDSRYTRLEVINAELKKDIEAVTNENDELKKQFKKLLEQKVTLWQHADDLEQDHIAMGTWVDSKTVTECMNCSAPFTMFARKHHCRACGKVLCGKCCIHKIQLAVSKDPSRVCGNCLERIQKKRTPFASEYINAQSLMESAAETLMASTTRPRSNATLLAADVEDIQHTSPARLSSGRGSSGTGTPTYRVMSSNSLNIERTIDLSGNSLQAKLMVQNHTPDMNSGSSSPQQLGSSANIELDYSSEESNNFTSTVDSVRLQTNNNNDADEPSSNSIPRVGNGVRRSPLIQAELQDCSFRSVSSMEYSVDPELRMREAEKLRKQQEAVATNGSSSCDNFTVRSVQGATIDEDYYLIEPGSDLGNTSENRDTGNLANPREMLGSLDVGALASRLEKLNSSELQQKGLSRQRSISANGAGGECGEMKKIEIGEGAAHVVKVPIERAGTAVAWEFRTEPKGIAFGISFKEKADSTREDDVLPQKRCMSHKFTLNGDYCAQKKGIYILKFDNCHSKYTGRTLYYRVWTKVSN